MRLLLDTHVLVWAAFSLPKLSSSAVALLSDTRNTRYFSAVSIWEIAIKAELGRADFKVDAKVVKDGLLANGYTEVPVLSTHGITAAKLHSAHKDPFDRMLLAQAQEEGLSLVTADASLIAFGPPALAI